MRSKSICESAVPTVKTIRSSESLSRIVTARTLHLAIAVPIILALADVAANRTALKFLLLPPFGALAYTVLVNPARLDLNLRRLVLAPTAATVIAWILGNELGYTPVSVAVATGATTLVMWLFGALTIVPCLALELLALLLHRQVGWNVGYPLAVFLFTVILFGMHLILRHRPDARDAAGA